MHPFCSLHISCMSLCANCSPGAGREGVTPNRRWGHGSLRHSDPSACPETLVAGPASSLPLLCPVLTSWDPSLAGLSPAGCSSRARPQSSCLQGFNPEQLNFSASKDLQGHLGQPPGLGRRVGCPHSWLLVGLGRTRLNPEPGAPIP